MHSRRGNWRIALGFGRPRCQRRTASNAVAADQRPRASPVISGGIKTQNNGDSFPLASLSFSIAGTISHTTLLAAFSEHALQMRARSLSVSPQTLQPHHYDYGPVEQVFTLQQALASRDAFCVFCTILQQVGKHVVTGAGAAPKSEVEELLFNAAGEAESVATMLCACVAVTLNPAEWPSWVSIHFTSSGTASFLMPANCTPGSDTAGGASLATAAHTWTALSSLHRLAAHTLHRLVYQLPRSSGTTASSPLPLLRWLAQLCGVCLAPSPSTALRLAQEAGKVSLDAAGVALKAHCAASVVTVQDDVHPPQQHLSATVSVKTVPQEERWLSLWTQLTQPSAAPPSPAPFTLSAAVTSGHAESWSSGLAPDALRKTRVSWHLHCLLTLEEMHHAARLLAGTYKDACLTKTGRGERNAEKQQGVDFADVTEGPRVALPITQATQVELLAALPRPLLEEDQLGARLSFSLLTEMQDRICSQSEGRVTPRPVRPPWPFVPAVSTHAVAYARMLRYILSSTAQVQRESSYVQHLHDVASLLSNANVHALAASFVPAGQPLTVVMQAEKDTYREEHMQHVVSAVRAVVDVLCEEPTPLSTRVSPSIATPSPSGKQKDDALAVVTKSFPSQRATRRKRTTQIDTHSLRVEQAPNTLGAFSWKWREEVMGDVDGVVQAAVHLLTSLLELCSSRKTSLPLRKAEPKWRRELRERTAVRAHKFEVLLQELPHAEISAVLHTLLEHGYHREGSQLGVSLLKGDQVDLRYYSLPLLGSLYLAVSTSGVSPVSSSVAEEVNRDDANESDRWKQSVYQMYRRRFEIYGDADLNVTPSSYVTPQVENTQTTALTCATENPLVAALVLASMVPTAASLTNGTAELANCLLNRRVVVAGRGIVVDIGVPYTALDGRSVFGPWIRKGTAML